MCLELDAAGQLLLSCRASGALGVHDVGTLRHQASLLTDTECGTVRDYSMRLSCTMHDPFCLF